MGTLGFICLILVLLVYGDIPCQPPLLTEQEAIDLIWSLSNWKRWGDDDQLGLLNLVITPEKRKQALSLVENFKVVSLSRDMDFNGITPATTTQSLRSMKDTGEDRHGDPQPGRGNYASELLAFVFHGKTITHLDGLSHFFWKGIMYGNRSSSLVNSRHGAEMNSVVAAKEGIMTRGVLFDIPRIRGVPYLDPLNSAIYAEDLQAICDKYNITLTPGDALVLRTGFWYYNTIHGIVDPSDGAPGLDVSAMPWLKKMMLLSLQQTHQETSCLPNILI